MGLMKCYDGSKMLLEAATDEFFPFLDPDEGRLDFFRENCEMLDELARTHRGIRFEVEVDYDTSDIIVTLISINVTAFKSKPTLYRLMQNAKKVSFTLEDSDHIRSRFTLPGIWRCAF